MPGLEQQWQEYLASCSHVDAPSAAQAGIDLADRDSAHRRQLSDEGKGLFQSALGALKVNSVEKGMAVSMMAQGDRLMEGFLGKWPTKPSVLQLKQFQQRYFVLCGRFLAYYQVGANVHWANLSVCPRLQSKPENIEENPKGVFDLRQAVAFAIEDDNSCSFEVHLATGTENETARSEVIFGTGPLGLNLETVVETVSLGMKCEAVSAFDSLLVLLWILTGQLFAYT
jgi:hypothetical protein